MVAETCDRGHSTDMTDRKQRTKQDEARDDISSKTPPSDTIPIARPHYLKFSEPPKIEPPAGAQSIQNMNLWGTFHIQAIRINKQPNVKERKI
jgi:hypothetical protein